MRIRHSPGLFAALVLMIASTASRAQDANQGEKYALLVGVKSYDSDDLRGLRYSEADVTDLSGVLRRGGYEADHVVLMTRSAGESDPRLLPTAEGIRKELTRITGECKADDSVIVALSGQGIQFRDGDKVYFCPADARLADRSTLIAIEGIYDVLAKCPARVKLVLLDVSHRDPQSDDSRSKSGALLESVARPQSKAPAAGVAAFYSCAAGEESYEHADLKHGVFFHHVIGGLSGDAASGGEHVVTLGRLDPYVGQQVNRFVREKFFERQVPTLVGDTNRSVPLAKVDAGIAAVRKARDLVKDGEFEKALAALDDAVKANPSLVAARFERASVYNQLRRYDDAVTDAREVLRLEPNNPDLRLTGAWYGTYAYPNDQQEPVRFRLNLIQDGGRVSINVKEPNTFWETTPNVARDAPFLFAFGSGQYDPSTRELKFTKTYDGASGASHAVEYSGNVSEDGNKFEGTWNIGGFMGTFKARRFPPGNPDPGALN